MELIVMYENLLKEVKSGLDFSELYLTPVSLRYNYAHKKRSEEVKRRLLPLYVKLLDFRKKFTFSCKSIYTDDTVIEWLSVYLEPYLEKIYNILSTIAQQKNSKSWRPRPLPIKLRHYNSLI